jgi:magnesium-transporting ATPase (P-type)
LLKSSLENGISNDDLSKQERVHFFGANVIPKGKSKTFLRLMLDALADTLLIILSIASVFSIIVGSTIAKDPSVEWIEGLAIMSSVVIVVLVTALNDYQKEKQFKALQAKQV